MSVASVVSYVVSGNVLPARFVQAVPNQEFTVYQADGTLPLVGIMNNGTYYAPGTPADNGYAGINGFTARVYGPPEEALLEIGAAVTAEQYLVSDASGRGIPGSLTSTSHQDFGAIALQTDANVGAKIRVQVVRLPGRQA